MRSIKMNGTKCVSMFTLHCQFAEKKMFTLLEGVHAMNVAKWSFIYPEE